MKLQCKFCILDVKHGRKGLLRQLKKRPINIKLQGKILGAWSRDDGESQEFEVLVDKIKVE